MAAVLDFPCADRPINPVRFNVRGWVWLGDAHPAVTSVEAWSCGLFLGQSMGLVPRPDVVRALGLQDDIKPGFDFFADLPTELHSTELELTMHARMVDGSRSDALCGVRVQVVKPARIMSGPDVQRAGSHEAQASQIPAGEVRSEAMPPEHLQVRQVGGVWGSRFFSEGRVIFSQIAAALREFGHPLEAAQRVLDFGCGCGRVLRGFEGVTHGAEVWGCDIDAEAIEWNSRHLAHVGRFVCNPTLPPTGFDRGFFDTVYSVSVFTHLPEEMQFAWLTELRRIVRPNGLVILSTHGAHHWQGAEPDVRLEVENNGMAYRSVARTEGLPDYYMVAFHSVAYIRRRWSWFFEVVAIKEKYIHGTHDVVILRRRED